MRGACAWIVAEAAWWNTSLTDGSLRWASSSRRCSDIVWTSSRTLPRGTPVPHGPQTDGVAEGSEKHWTLSRKLRRVALRRGALRGVGAGTTRIRVCETARRSRRRQTAQVARFLFRLVPAHAHFWNRLSGRRQDDCQKRGVQTFVAGEVC